MSEFGIDYSFGSGLTAAQMKAAGVKFVCRYLDYLPNKKVINSTEAVNLVKAGIEIVLVFESTAERMKGGRAAGIADAQEADKQAKALGFTGIPIYFACDFNATPGDQAEINAYLDGVASVIGIKRTGIYGGYWPCMRAWQARKVTFVWQTYAWSGNNVPGNSADLGGVTRHIFQYSNGRKLGPASVDFDRKRMADAGQWPRPKVQADPPPAPRGAAQRRIADGKQSLNAVAAMRHTTAAHIVEESFEPKHLNDDHKLALALYLAFPGADTVMPEGLVYWTSH